MNALRVFWTVALEANAQGSSGVSIYAHQSSADTIIVGAGLYLVHLERGKVVSLPP